MPRAEFPGPSSQVSCRPHRPSRCWPSCSTDSDFSSIPSGSDCHERPPGCGTSKYAGCVSDQGSGVTTNVILQQQINLMSILFIPCSALHKDESADSK